jgi:hypothetical protein
MAFQGHLIKLVFIFHRFKKFEEKTLTILVVSYMFLKLKEFIVPSTQKLECIHSLKTF